MEIEGYEYKVQVWDKYATPPRWINTLTNQFNRDEWYPSLGNAKNAMAQLKATRYNRVNEDEYRIIQRPYGGWEVVDTNVPSVS